MWKFLSGLLEVVTSSWIPYAIAGMAITGLLWYVHHEGYASGYADYEKKQIIAQKKQNLKVKKDYAGIDGKTPNDPDSTAAFNWLLDHTRSGE